jgi:DNA replicative helicase MCM subunit Mcm2 (Cdc46/Mcm family)
MTKEIHIKQLDLDMINPNAINFENPDQGGSKIVIIGKPGTGKSTLLASLLYAKRDIFPSGMVVSGTEDSNGFYSRIMPPSFVHTKYNEDKINNFIVRQKLAKRHLPNPWAVLLLDDCTDDPKILSRPQFQGIFKNGRHWKMLFFLSLQYCMDVRPVIRTNVDGTFILRESNLRNRRSLYENYCGAIPTFDMFCQIMDQITNDYTALYIHNSTTSNNLEDIVFYYKAQPVPSNFRFGNKDFWKFHHHRFDPSHADSF